MAKEEKKGGAQPQEKLTYERLQKIAQDLVAQNNYLKTQNQQLLNKVQELSDFSLFKRLDYLFKVMELSSKFPAEFVTSCSEEIVARMTLPAEAPAEEAKKENEEKK